MRRFSLYLSALFLSISFATAQTYEISPSTGTLANGNGTTKSSVWTSNELEGFTLKSTCNDEAVDAMNVNSGFLQLFANNNNCDITYTINAPEGYSINNYVIIYKKGSSSYGITITAENGATQTPGKTTAEQTFEVADLSGTNTVFTLKGTTSMKDFIKITSFAITLQKTEEGSGSEGGEAPDEDSTIKELYAAITKPSFEKAGNTTFVKTATLTDGVEAEVTGIQAASGQACVTNAINVEKGAQFNLNITYQLNWGDLAIYQIENDEATKKYGYYYGSWEPNGSTAKVVQNIVEDEISVTEIVDGSCTVTFPISISENHTPGDIVVVRAITGVINNTTNSAFEQNITEGGYVDFLLVITEPKETSYTLTVGETGWATLCLDTAVEIPAGIEVWTVAEVVDDCAVMEEVLDIIPANCPVLVKATRNGDWEFEYTTETGKEYTNLLKGTTKNEYITEDAYVLTPDGNGDVCFGKAIKNQLDDTAWLNNANKAYLPASVLPEAAQGTTNFSFRFPDTTAIEQVVTENEIKAIFDLTGHRVESITKRGIYIINGKKVLVK